MIIHHYHDGSFTDSYQYPHHNSQLLYIIYTYIYIYISYIVLYIYIYIYIIIISISSTKSPAKSPSETQAPWPHRGHRCGHAAGAAGRWRWWASPPRWWRRWRRSRRGAGKMWFFWQKMGCLWIFDDFWCFLVIFLWWYIYIYIYIYYP